MKKIIILLCFIPSFSVGQVNPSIVDTTKVWSVLSLGGGHGYYHESTYSYKFQGDTTINEKTYKKVFGTYDSTEQHSSWYFTKMAIREDAHKVYLCPLYNLSEEEYLIYDFNLVKGDSVRFKEMSGEMYPPWIFVDAVDSIEVSGSLLKRITFTFTPEYYWIEGIGSSRGIIYSENFSHEYRHELLCVTQENNQIYTNPTYNTCYIQVGIDKPEVINTKIYPTIVRDYVHIESDKYPLRVSVFDILGKCHLQETITSNGQLPCNQLPSGFYILKIQGINSYQYDIRKIIKQ